MKVPSDWIVADRLGRDIGLVDVNVNVKRKHLEKGSFKGVFSECPIWMALKDVMKPDVHINVFYWRTCMWRTNDLGMMMGKIGKYPFPKEVVKFLDKANDYNKKYFPPFDFNLRVDKRFIKGEQDEKYRS